MECDSYDHVLGKITAYSWLKLNTFAKQYCVCNVSVFFVSFRASSLS